METKAVVLLKKAALAFDKMANMVLQPMNLTGAQYKIVKYLLEHQEEPVRQVDLENFYSLTHPTAIGLLDMLEQKGFIERKVNPQDARSRIIILTEMALSQQEALIEVGNTLEAKLTVGLSEEERSQLILLLGKVLSDLE